MNEKEWKEVNPERWKPEVAGDYIAGVLVHKDAADGDLSARYTLDTKDNGLVLVWGSTVLDQRMKYLDVGSRCCIEYKGTEETKKGRTVKIFKVYEPRD